MERLWKWKADHIAFWVVTVGFHIYTRLAIIDSAGWWPFAGEIVIRNLALALVIYANLEYLLPVYALRQRISTYVFGLAGLLTMYVLVKDTHDYYQSVFTGKTQSFWQYSFYNLSIALFYLSFSLALELSKQWYFQRKRLQQIEIEKLNTELAFLKAQINPHFLFNSLNTIFFQIDKTNEIARDTLTKFSEMLRFQLYECNEPYVFLHREIQYLRNYVDLQRLRRDHSYSIRFEAHGVTGDRMIAPMLLLPLVENAFKHVSHFAEGNLVYIRIEESERGIELLVKNTKEQRIGKTEPGGIGLRNLQRRLELQYEGKYDWKIEENRTEYTSCLLIRI